MINIKPCPKDYNILLDRLAWIIWVQTSLQALVVNMLIGYDSHQHIRVFEHMHALLCNWRLCTNYQHVIQLQGFKHTAILILWLAAWALAWEDMFPVASRSFRFGSVDARNQHSWTELEHMSIDDGTDLWIARQPVSPLSTSTSSSTLNHLNQSSQVFIKTKLLTAL